MRYSGMKKVLLASAFLFIPSIAWAQCTGVFPANTVCGNVTGSPAVPSAQSTASFVSGVTGPTSTFVGDLATWSNTLGTNLADTPPGVFNPRLKFGAIPDNSTDNSTAFVSIFALSNAYSNGVPTVYFDCGANATTCVYKYSSSTSPSAINPTVPTTILCAPGVTLNYTGTTHAADIGSGTDNTAGAQPYTVQGCTWTGGTSQAQGLEFKNFVTNPLIVGNTFLNFGPTVPTSVSGAALHFLNNNYEPIIVNNRFIDQDAVPRNGVDSHNSGASVLYFANNIFDCQNGPPGNACQTSPAGYGIWVQGARVTGNLMFAHYPNIRYGSANFGLTVINNHFEGNASPSPLITYGDPNTTGVTLSNVDISHNDFFQLSASAGVPIIGPETASSGSFSLGASVISFNNFTSPAGSGSTILLGNGIANNRIFDNLGYNGQFGNTPLTPSQMCDTNCSVGAFAGLNFQGYSNTTSPSFIGDLIAFDSTGAVANAATLNNVAQPLICKNTTNSNSQVCVTNPEFAPVGGVLVPVNAGSIVIYTSTQANTGDVTLTVNGTTAHIKKYFGTQVLSQGDISANVYYLLVYDGTNYELMNPSKTLSVGPFTFANLPGSPVTGTVAYISDALAGNCGDGSCTTFGTSLSAGTGALNRLVWWNGANWTMIGK